uniref:Uncharacterized protein n=1 Tax=Chenopodium quinoa TaxID=63459 RepID=A0A803MZN4_CHEQI
MRCQLRQHPELDKLMEVVMDLGRNPIARFPSGDFELSDCPITFQDLEFATSQCLVNDAALARLAGELIIGAALWSLQANFLEVYSFHLFCALDNTFLDFSFH